MTDYTLEARERFAEDLFATKATGIIIEEARVDYARCVMEIQNIHKNAANAVMGGAIFTLADFAFAVAANTGHELTVSLTSSVNFLNGTRGTCLFGEATCVKSGKTTCLYEIHITDDTGKIIAVVTTTGYRKV